MWLQDKSISIFFLLISIVMIRGSLKLGLGDLGNPGPGFAPLLVSLLIVILVVVDLFRGKLRAKGAEGVANRAGRYRGIALVSALCFYVVTLEFFGYLLSAFILIFTSVLLFDRKKWRFPLFLAVIVVNLSYFLFAKLLQVQLPAGRLGITW
jgi:putative tricarboxylic transport membrane protein